MASGKNRGPRLPDVVSRGRLFERFQESLAKSQGLWIAGLPGAGKTTALASYLTQYQLRAAWLQIDAGDSDPATFFDSLNESLAPFQQDLLLPQQFTAEYFNAVNEFTRSYFETLAASVELPMLIVLDNYQEMADTSRLHLALAELVPYLPEGVSLVFVSRGAPPSAFARAVLNRVLAVVDEKQLRLSGEEALSIARLQSRTVAVQVATEIEGLCERVDGWVAGLILLLEQREAGFERFAFDAATTQILFNYFATVIFERADDTARQVLMSIAVLPFASSGMACALSRSAAAGEILEALHRKNYFVSYRTESDTYQCHPLFQAFLRARLTTACSREDLIALRCQAAELLEQLGYLEEALALYREAGQMAAMVRLILQLAPAVVAHGRLKDLQEWIGAVPHQTRTSTAWLRYWQGICRVPFDGDESCEHFEAAFASFDAADIVGRVLACVGLVESIVLMWRYFEKLDVWIDRINALPPAALAALPEQVRLRCAASMSCALILRRPHQPNLADWLERARRPPTADREQGSQLMSLAIAITFHGVMGHLDSLTGSGRFAAAIGHESGRDPLVEIAGKYVQSAREFVTGRLEAAMAQAEQGLAAIERSGAYIWYPLLLPACMYFALSSGNRKAIELYHERLGRFFTAYPSAQRGVQQYCEAWYALFHGDASSATAAAQKAVDSTSRGTPYTELFCRFVLAQAHIDSGTFDTARSAIHAGQELAHAINAPLMQYAFELIEAELAIATGDTHTGAAILRRALLRGRDAGFTCFLGWLPVRMTRIFAHALQQGIEVRFVQERIRSMRTAFVTPPAYLEAWPWPLKIHTLGRFTVLADDEPMHFEGKAPKRSLEFLAALAGCGGEDVREDWLQEALWGDATDSDKAANSLTTAVNRLRNLIGHDAIRRQRGFVRLNPLLCWTDVGALSHFMNLLESSSRQGNGCAVEQSLQRIRKLYRGGFLAHDTDASWALGIRDELQRKLRRHLRIAGERLQRSGLGDEARECFDLERELQSPASGTDEHRAEV